jgi:hypothetical protein
MQDPVPKRHVCAIDGRLGGLPSIMHKQTPVKSYQANRLPWKEKEKQHYDGA